MFERYTEKARRVIFFARYEASQFGSPLIETEYLLLGLAREDKALTGRFFPPHGSIESIRKQIEGHTIIRESISTSVDLPLSDESKRVLAFAAEEAERFAHKHIGPEHLLLGMLREEKCFAAAILQGLGLKLGVVREQLARSPHNSVSAKPTPESPLLAECARDLTKAASDNLLDPLVGRKKEIEALIEVLCSRNNRNPLLISERSAASGAIVELLAQHIVDGDVPASLADKRLVALDLEQLIEGTADSQTSKERLVAVVKELVEDPSFIVFIEDIRSLSQFDNTGVFRRALLNGDVQCIGASTATDYPGLMKIIPWFGRCFRTIKVPPMSEEDIIRSLVARKTRLEKFHAVHYSDEAIDCAARYSMLYFPGDASFDKATEMLDAAGTRVKLRQTTLPDEVTEVQKRIKFIVHRMDNAIANHEFEKARFYSDEERKERENLRILQDKYHVDHTAANIVSRTDLEDVVSRWTGLPLATIREGRFDEDEASVASPATTQAQDGLRSSSGLRVFMCHASGDKPAVRELYERLKRNRIEPWLDAEDLLAGQEWRYEIEKAVRLTHIVLVCLSAHSVNKTGFVHKEIKIALDVADQQPDGTIFVIPLKLEECEVPDRLRQWQWVNLYEENGFERLMRALLQRAHSIGIAGTQNTPPITN
jgi:ATP-dependent Clp protease ATP-binding subunit ClpC